MSRSNPTKTLVHPSERWFRFNAKTGKLSYWDKENKEEVDVKLPFTFLLLDELSTVGGYNKRAKSGIYANEVRSVRDDKLTVKYFNGGDVIAEGQWKDISAEVKEHKGKFVSQVYVAFRDGKQLKIGGLSLSGNLLFSWGEFKKKHRDKIEEDAVIMTDDLKLVDEGDTPYYLPKWDLKVASEKTKEDAFKLDEALQEYLNEYLARQGTTTAKEDDVQEHPPEDRQLTPDEIAEMEAARQENSETEADDPGDEPTSDDVPF